MVMSKGWNVPVPPDIEHYKIVGDGGLTAVVSTEIVLAVSRGELMRALKARPAKVAARVFRTRKGLIVPVSGSPLSAHLTDAEAERRQR